MVSIAPQNMTIRWNLSQLMLERGMKPADLHQATGLHPNTISKLRNRWEMPDRLDKDTLNKLCSALGCQPGDLLRYIPDEIQPAAEPIATEVDEPIATDTQPARSRRKTSPPPVQKTQQEFKAGQMVKNPAGWRGWITKLLDDKRAIVDWEGQINGDVIPLHLLKACE